MFYNKTNRFFTTVLSKETKVDKITLIKCDNKVNLIKRLKLASSKINTVIKGLAQNNIDSSKLGGQKAFVSQVNSTITILDKLSSKVSGAIVTKVSKQVKSPEEILEIRKAKAKKLLADNPDKPVSVDES